MVLMGRKRCEFESFGCALAFSKAFWSIIFPVAEQNTSTLEIHRKQSPSKLHEANFALFKWVSFLCNVTTAMFRVGEIFALITNMFKIILEAGYRVEVEKLCKVTSGFLKRQELLLGMCLCFNRRFNETKFVTHSCILFQKHCPLGTCFPNFWQGKKRISPPSWNWFEELYTAYGCLDFHPTGSKPIVLAKTTP